MDQWSGKVAVVTGASVGIGAAIAKALVEHGMQVIGAARREEILEELAESLKDLPGMLHPYKIDITNENEIVEMFQFIKDNWGGVDVLVNNAGITTDAQSLMDGDTEGWRKLLETNVLALCTASREAVRSMKERDVDGYIFHISSYLGHAIPVTIAPFLNMYPASKFAVQALAECLHQEIIHDGRQIKVTTISPGLVQTGLTKDFGATVQKKLTPLRPVDVANALLYALGTPPDVLVSDLVIRPIDE